MDQAAREEFRDYVTASSSALLRTAYLMTGNRADAEDLVQTALAKTYLAWPRIRDREAIDGYVRRVMVNTRTSWWRKSRHLTTVPHDEALDRRAQPGDAFADADLRDALWHALGRLPRRQRAAVVLRYYEQLSEAETAAALGVSTGTVKSTVSRALRKLRDDAGLQHDARADLPIELQGANR
ncbi:MAG TPA: SigE family RNA polymerase sigma factor [Mycobacteriales bacterium]|nr:SigE family RNA polymerase sigma factor [Mycobacteriales bacterium]